MSDPALPIRVRSRTPLGAPPAQAAAPSAQPLRTVPPATRVADPAPAAQTRPAGTPLVARTQARLPSQAPTPPGGGGGWMKSGADARSRSEAELARQRDAAAKRNAPRAFRFWTGVGQQREIVILDTHPGPCFYEHQLQNMRTGKWDIHEACPKEWEPCPLCDGAAGGKESYYVMMLTCVELAEWTDKHGTVHPYSVRLLPVKAEQQGFFLRQYDRHGSLRGLRLLMTRDTKQSAAIGMPEFIEMVPAENIVASFGHGEMRAQDGRVIKQANADCHPLDYGKLFRKPSGADLRTRYGGVAPAGSQQDIDAAWEAREPEPHTHDHANDAGGSAADDVNWDEPGSNG